MYQREEGRAKVDNEKQDLGMEKAMQLVINFQFSSSSYIFTFTSTTSS